MLLKLICHWIFRLKGWQVQGSLPPELKQCVIIGAPHTSNWDFIYMMAVFYHHSIPTYFTIKKEWLRFPLSTIFKSIGAIAIDRSPRRAGKKRVSSLDIMVNLFSEYEYVGVLVTPEGTRSPVKQWKMGFYHIAVRAKVPIVLGYVDYAKKQAGMRQVFYPTGNQKQDILAIRAFYRDITPCYPDKFIQVDLND